MTVYEEQSHKICWVLYIQGNLWGTLSSCDSFPAGAESFQGKEKNNMHSSQKGNSKHTRSSCTLGGKHERGEFLLPSQTLGWHLEAGLGSVLSGTSRKPKRMQLVTWEGQARWNRWALGFNPWLLNRNAGYELVLCNDQEDGSLTAPSKCII